MTYLQSKALKVSHGFFTRNGGVSLEGYWSLNCSFGVGDKAEHVRQNLDIACKHLSLKPGAIAVLNQVHGREVLVLNEANWPKFCIGGGGKLYNADALVTAVPEVGIGILTADCAPILFCDCENQIIGAAHTGWRGAFGGVIESTVAAIKSLGGKGINAAIGPCIHKESYPVGSDMLDLLLNADKNNQKFFKAGEDGAHHFDLVAYAKSRLISAGVVNIDVINIDTFADQNFFSYRRNSLSKKFNNCGRQISSICLKKS
ncbi:MAG: peptidoglycan editing factor PgeF [Holosporales bacterium]|jgi:YfiH family protein|nr:peptidoglycan editing factor PgeF [Holosporales bacterium]